MAILEGLGPKRKVFDDLPPGDYLFEISPPGEQGWIKEFTDKDDNGNDTKAVAQYVNWKLRTLIPEEFEGKPFFHMTMFDATPEKIAKAKSAYDPAGFTYQFLGAIGAGIVSNGEMIVLDDYLTKGDIDLDKLIGLRFWGSVRVKNMKGTDRTILEKVWKE
jgi:hypothetical protein